MMDSQDTRVGCPVCLEGIATTIRNGDNRKFDCPRCGQFIMSDTAHSYYVDDKIFNQLLNAGSRAALSNLLRTGKVFPRYGESIFPHIKKGVLSDQQLANLQPILPTEQARRLIRYIGSNELEHGTKVSKLDDDAIGYVGATNRQSFEALVYDVYKRDLVSLSDQRSPNIPRFSNVGLTLAGWEEWERSQNEGTISSDGFIAMQFGDNRLDNIISELVQKRAAQALGISIHRIDSPGKTRSGLIDNNMREAIEDAAFVLVELSHGNRGAYWEAGLAEGLRKPVIYLCEQAAWDDPERRPHFDVNHRTTIMWDEAEPDKFVESLVATIRNSLRHHGLEKGRATE